MSTVEYPILSPAQLRHQIQRDRDLADLAPDIIMRASMGEATYDGMLGFARDYLPLDCLSASREIAERKLWRNRNQAW